MVLDHEDKILIVKPINFIYSTNYIEYIEIIFIFVI
jgi:hypothetical protein